MNVTSAPSFQQGDFLFSDNDIESLSYFNDLEFNNDSIALKDNFNDLSSFSPSSLMMHPSPDQQQSISSPTFLDVDFNNFEGPAATANSTSTTSFSDLSFSPTNIDSVSSFVAPSLFSGYESSSTSSPSVPHTPTHAFQGIDLFYPDSTSSMLADDITLLEDVTADSSIDMSSLLLESSLSTPTPMKQQSTPQTQLLTQLQTQQSQQQQHFSNDDINPENIQEHLNLLGNSFEVLNQNNTTNTKTNTNTPRSATAELSSSSSSSSSPPALKPLRKQSESRLSLPELYIRMGLGHDHEEARIREQRVLGILRAEGFKLGERTWIRDTTENERKRIIDEIYTQTYADYKYSKEMIEVIVRRGSYYLMQGRLRRIRRGKKAMQNSANRRQQV